MTHGRPQKPTTAPSPYVGCGTYAFTPAIFADAHETPRSTRTGRLELTDVIDHVARRGGTVRVLLDGDRVRLGGQAVTISRGELL